MKTDIEKIKYFLNVLLRWKSFIIIVVLGTLFFTYFLGRKMPKVYTAKATAIVMQEEGGGFGGLLGGAMAGLSLKSGGSSGMMILSMLESRTMMLDVVNKFNLREKYKYPFDSAVIYKLSRRVRINYLELKNLMTIRVKTEGPELSADIANFFFSNLEKMNEKLKISTEKNLVTVLDKAVPPDEPNGPFLRKLLATALVLSVFCSSFIALILELSFAKLKKD